MNGQSQVPPRARLQAYTAALRAVAPCRPDAVRACAQAEGLATDPLTGHRLHPVLVARLLALAPAGDGSEIADLVYALEAEAACSRSLARQWDVLLAGLLRTHGDQRPAMAAPRRLQDLITGGHIEAFRQAVSLALRRPRSPAIMRLYALLAQPLYPQARSACWHAAAYLARCLAIQYPQAAKRVRASLLEDRPAVCDESELRRLAEDLRVVDELSGLKAARRLQATALVRRADRQESVDAATLSSDLISDLDDQHWIRARLSIDAPGVADRLRRHSRFYVGLFGIICTVGLLWWNWAVWT